MSAVSAYIDAHQTEYVALLQVLCHQPSVAAQGIGIPECAPLVARQCSAQGLEVRTIQDHGGNPVVLAEHQVPGAARTLLFYNHYDVQPPEPLDAWESPPYAAEVRDGKLYARGVADNKGNIAARLAAFDAVRQTTGLRVNVKFVVEGEEEIGSPSLARFVKQHMEELRADGCIWETGYKNEEERVVIYLGTKGMLYVEFRARGPNRDMHSSYGVITPNPAWRLIHALGTIRDDQGRVRIPGFYDAVRPPTKQERQLAERYRFPLQRFKTRYGLRRLLGGDAREVRRRLFLEPTCNICGLYGGYMGVGSKTVLPATVTAKADFRLVPNQTPEQVLTLLRRHLAAHGFDDIEVVVIDGSYPATRSSPESLIARVTRAAAAEVYGQEPVLAPSMAGSGPMYLFTQVLGIPTASAGVGYADSRVHAPNENIRLTDYVQGIKHVATILQRFAAM